MLPRPLTRQQRRPQPDLLERLPLWVVALLGCLVVPAFLIGMIWATWVISIACGIAP